MFTIFEKLGGEEATLALLKEGAIRESWPSNDTLKAWRKKRELPGSIVLRIMNICDERGISYSAADFKADSVAGEAAQ